MFITFARDPQLCKVDMIHSLLSLDQGMKQADEKTRQPRQVGSLTHLIWYHLTTPLAILGGWYPAEARLLLEHGRDLQPVLEPAASPGFRQPL